MRHENYKELMQKLAEEHTCFVLITCDEAASDGNMNVNMSWEGDPVLASYLLNGALSKIDSEIESEVNQSRSNLRIVK